MLEKVVLPLTDTTVVMTSWNLLVTGLGVEMEELDLEVVWALFVVLAGVKAVWDVGPEVAAFSGDDNGSVAVADSVVVSGFALVRTEGFEEVGEEVEISAADVDDATVAPFGVEAGDVCCVALALVEAPLGLRVTCR